MSALVPAESLPHWLVHEMGVIIGGIRVELTWEMLDRPLGEGTLGDALSGVGNIPRQDRTPEMLNAEQIMFDHHRLVELWLGEATPAVAEWVPRILKAGALLVRDAPISSDYLEWQVLESPLAPWRAVCEEWGRRLEPLASNRVPEMRPPVLVFPTPEWLSAAERRLLMRSAEWVIEESRRARMRELAPIVRRIADVHERREELFVVEQEMLQVAEERGETLCADIAAQQEGFALGLAAAAHAAASARAETVPEGGGRAP